MSKEIIVTSKNGVVLSNGKAFISQVKVSELLGIPRSTLQQWMKKNRQDITVNENNQLDAKSVVFIAKLGRLKYNQSEIFLDKVSEGGANLVLQSVLGYVKPVDLVPTGTNYLRHLADLMDAKADKEATEKSLELKASNKRIDALETKLEAELATKATKGKTLFNTVYCGKGYANLSWFRDNLQDSNHPISYSALSKFRDFYFTQLRNQGNCINKEDFKSILNSVIYSAKEVGAYYEDEESGIKFKADWLKEK
jgi:hypothetical protein